MAIDWLFSKAGSEKGVKPETALLCRFIAFLDDGKPWPLYTQSCLELQTARDYPNVNYYKKRMKNTSSAAIKQGGR